MNRCICGIDTEHTYCSVRCRERVKKQRQRNVPGQDVPGPTSSSVPSHNGAWDRGYCECGIDAYCGGLCIRHYTEAITAHSMGI